MQVRIAIVSVLTGLSVAAPAVAVAAPSPIPAPVSSMVTPGGTGGNVPSYKVVDITNFRDTAFGAFPIGTCHTQSAGSSCTISQTENFATSISVSGGITVGAVAATLGWDRSWSSGTTVGCTSPALPAGTSYSAYPFGDQANYRIETIVDNRVVSLSKELIAYHPKPHQIACD